MSEAIRLMHYDPRWPQEFQQTRSSILQSCEGWIVEVDHIGSTSISGLVAQPIIDVVALVADLNGWEFATTCLEGLNFRLDVHESDANAPDWMQQGRRLVKPRHGQATHTIYLFPQHAPAVAAMLRFRDTLAADRDRALAFEEEKVDCWRSTGGDSVLYAHWKETYFARFA